MIKGDNIVSNTWRLMMNCLLFFISLSSSIRMLCSTYIAPKKHLICRHVYIFLKVYQPILIKLYLGLQLWFLTFQSMEHHPCSNNIIWTLERKGRHIKPYDWLSGRHFQGNVFYWYFFTCDFLLIRWLWHLWVQWSINAEHINQVMNCNIEH